MRRACALDTNSTYLVTMAACLNFSDSAARQSCMGSAKTSFHDEARSCQDQLAARLQVCTAVGEQRYDPDFSQGAFDADYQHPSILNPFMPLVIGDRWDYQGSGEFNQVEILSSTKSISGVQCVVQHDQVFKGGFRREDTYDWLAQGRDGSVWYCGESSTDYATTALDHPAVPELVSIDGSFKAGRGFDKPGVLFLANPQPGVTYREEVSLDNAEDVSTIVSTTYRYGESAELDRLVPRGLAQLLCRGDCVVTHAYSPLETGVVETKYFAPGIGFILSTVPSSGEISQLVGCNFDPRCASLPKP